MTAVGDQFFAEVGALSESAQTMIIPDGEVWEIQKFVGAAAYDEGTKACLVWDYGGAEVLLYSTHGDGSFSGDDQLTGDGVKKVAICLVNDTASAQTLGGQFSGLVVS